MKGVAVLLALANHDPPVRPTPPVRPIPHPGFGRSPLSWYFRALLSAGPAVTAFGEPEPMEGFMTESSQGPFLREVPLQCVVQARKLRAPRPRGVGTVHAGRGQLGRPPH